MDLLNVFTPEKRKRSRENIAKELSDNGGGFAHLVFGGDWERLLTEYLPLFIEGNETASYLIHKCTNHTYFDKNGNKIVIGAKGFEHLNYPKDSEPLIYSKSDVEKIIAKVLRKTIVTQKDIDSILN